MDNCAFDRGEICSVLSEKECERCSFFKTEEELKTGRERSRKRIEGLPLEDQKHINNKYYDQRKRSNDTRELI